MSYLSKLRDYYPKSWAIRHALNNWHTHLDFEHREPTTVTLHYISQCYGGPEEGGWWYTQGWPEETHCIFNKKQAIKRFIELADKYQIIEQPSLGDTTTNSNWEVNFSNNYAIMYPKERPFYC